MYVRSLRLAGFKSFAAPTILEFEPGVNVIVGPNGSGKSNIADALAWVLGSQAPSNLRGAAMEDVIFAGSANRPALGMAEVELTLDNSSGILPLDVAEVTVSRFTDRSGASEYAINGTSCRLLDVTELLSDTGIGRSLHALVGQGQLDQILQARPEDRRTFIEEAAQIGKFRKRKERALKKIERVEDNLMRLNDVLAELRRAIRPLKRQAGAAAAYSELMTEHQELKQRLTATELAALAAEAAALDVDAEERRRVLLADELASVRARLQSAADERESLRVAADQAQSVAYGMSRAADRLGALGRLSQERAARLAARLAAETEETYRERIRLLEAERDRWRREENHLQQRAHSVRARADEAAARAEDLKRTREDAEAGLARARAIETESAQALVRAEGSEAASRATIGSIEARVQAVVERIDVTGQELQQDGEAMATALRESRALEQELDQVTERAAEAEARLEAKRERVDALKDQLGSDQARLSAAEARRTALEEVAQLLHDLPEAPRRLAPLIDDARESEHLRAAGREDAAQVLAAAQEAVEREWHEVSRLDEELRRLDALMSGAVDRVAGAQRRREAREIELAAQNEELARNREALAAAETSAVEERAALPARRAAASEAASARADAEEAVRAARSAVERVADEAATAEIDARAAEERSLAARLRVEEAEAGIADAKSTLAGLANVRAELRAAVERAESVARQALGASGRGTRWAGEAAARAEAARTAAQSAEENLGSLRARERELDETLGEVVERRNRAEVRRAETTARAQAVAERALDEWGLSTDDLGSIEELADDEKPAARERVEELERQMKRLGAVNPRAAEEYEEAEERQSFLVGQIDDLKASKTDLLRVVKEVDDTIVEVFGTAFADVAREFETTFERLFPGGRGTLKLTDASDLLGSGIDIEARPPGKNIKKLSLLSGGERSLVALAFLFAIFRARPSPFYLLDEVEAALDDVNLQRFLGLVSDLREHAQVLIVTHQKRTMEAAQILYGVTMAKDGVSQVVAKRMEETAPPAEIRL